MEIEKKILSTDRYGKIIINPSETFIQFTKKNNWHKTKNQSIKDILDEIKVFVHNEKITLNINGSIEENSFRKCNGDWYEWIISLYFIDYYNKKNTDVILISLPNAKSFDVINLYNKELSKYIHEFREKLSLFEVSLITSNPDFVLIDAKNTDLSGLKLNEINLDNISDKEIIKIANLYKFFIGKAELEDILGYLSVKTTLRPDRRLQLAHEGSLMKALYTHLQTRTWTISPRGIKYYGASTKVTRADIYGLKTVATHSITDVKSSPQSAVDGIFEINSLPSLKACFDKILSI